MEGLEFVILFFDGRVHLTTNYSLDYESTNLPYLLKSNRKPYLSHWVIRIKKHFIEEKKLFTDVISYNSGLVDFPEYQHNYFMDFESIKELQFSNISTSALISTMASNNTNHRIVAKPRTLSTDRDITFQTAPFVISGPKRDIYSMKPEPIKFNFKDTIVLNFKNLDFCNGYVEFKWEILPLRKVITFQILNSDVIEAFDPIKNYFANCLQTKQISIELEIETLDGVVVNQTAKSAEIDRINKDFIENVRFDYVRKILKGKSNGRDNQNLFSVDELFKDFNEGLVNANSFYTDDSQFLKELLKIKKTKHYQYLDYLSERHLSNIMRLRFCLSPVSFIFLIESPAAYYMIWETLDTKEATYIWCENDKNSNLRLFLKKIDEKITLIKENGKRWYLDLMEDGFYRVNHDDYIKAEESFGKWLKEIEQLTL